MITFIIVGADEYALTYMEAHPTEFHNSNLANIESKIKSKSCDVDMIPSRALLQQQIMAKARSHSSP